MVTVDWLSLKDVGGSTNNEEAIKSDFGEKSPLNRVLHVCLGYLLVSSLSIGWNFLAMLVLTEKETMRWCAWWGTTKCNSGDMFESFWMTHRGKRPLKQLNRPNSNLTVVLSVTMLKRNKTIEEKKPDSPLVIHELLCFRYITLFFEKWKKVDRWGPRKRYMPIKHDGDYALASKKVYLPRYQCKNTLQLYYCMKIPTHKPSATEIRLLRPSTLPPPPCLLLICLLLISVAPIKRQAS